MFDSKVVLITGASGGLGASVTQAFLGAGASVTGVSRSVHAPESGSSSFTGIAAEITSAVKAREVVDTVVARSGRIDTLVHLVGGFAGGRSVSETEDETLERMFDLNFRTAFYLLKAVLPHMQARRSGCILAIGSRTAVEPQPALGVYSASKAALVSLMRTVALENKSFGISANVILPGTMDTPANRAADPGADPAKWVQPRQVAALLVHLASADASQVTGAVIPVYGGDL